MATKAIAYVSDVILGRTGEVIGREAQKEEIRRYAHENGVEIVAWYEDEVYNENVLSRPGITEMLERANGCDCIMVERVWALSRQWSVLRAFQAELERRGMRLEAATTLWDCVSQRARCYRKEATGRSRPVGHGAEFRAPARLRISKPRRLNFAIPTEQPELG